ncbi:hypothetical protein HDE_13909 [Halotydeus destructor]|nr:hypothetical protein HDE_13909 [Halotydeus destructor]
MMARKEVVLFSLICLASMLCFPVNGAHWTGAVVQVANMPDHMLDNAIFLTNSAIDAHSSLNDRAKFICDHLTTTYGGQWQCLIGPHGTDYGVHIAAKADRRTEFTYRALDVTVFQAA